ncbi:MAG: 4-alpha-glucanotransferase [Chitinophagales bacterium]|nr:4-alpha-glucanotransferase [Chitinophagales bacterium]
MNRKRRCGTLMHITSLPSPFGIGDLGPAAYQFAAFLRDTGQTIWQILPLNPTSEAMGNSPYSSPSAFAGNTLLISPELLVKEGFLDEQHLSGSNLEFSEKMVDYQKALKYKNELLHVAYHQWIDRNGMRSPEYMLFCKEQSAWLDDYALFMALKSYFQGAGWMFWDKDFCDRKPSAMAEVRTKLASTIEQEKFCQYLFFGQWNALKKYCNDLGILLFGDMPFYVGHDSADIWAHPEYFKLAANNMPTKVAGVPPDYFSETGQLWGNPIYDWKRLEKGGFSWWRDRLSHNLKLFDWLRLDHFRAFSAYWEVDAGEETALNGKWVETPGEAFFSTMQEQFPQLPIIAEDLGEIDQPVRDLMAKFDLPGMALLLFAFGEDLPTNAYAPHLHKRHLIVYTGTHDNITVKGWYKQEASHDDKMRLQHYVGKPLTPKTAPEAMIRLALMSVADTAIIPMQDWLGLGAKATMNRPSHGEGNWRWRLSPDAITLDLVMKYRLLIDTYGRAVES